MGIFFWIFLTNSHLHCRKRTRYYQSMIDMDSLMKGQDYSELKDSYILFICKRDPFKDEQKKHYELPCYTFKNTCSENPAVILNDKSLKVIYNASAYNEEKDEKVKAFLHFIHTNEPGKDDFTNRLSALVEQIKDNEKFRRDYAAMNLHDRDITRAAKQEGLRQGLAQGANRAKVEAAQNLWTNGVSQEIIAQSLGLPLAKVAEIINGKQSGVSVP